MPEPNSPTGADREPRFTVERRRLAEIFDHQDGEPYRLDAYGETPGEQIAGAVQEAERTGALLPPENTQLQILCPTAASVVLVIRESVPGRANERVAAGLPRERQVSSWHIETRSLTDGSETFAQLAGALENVCSEANLLLPALAALLEGESRLMDVIAQPIRVLTYNSRGRLGIYSACVADLSAHDLEQAKALWPLLVETLETGEAIEECDGERQRSLQLRYGGAPHLARQLLALRGELAEHGVRDLPKADPPLHTYLP